MIDATLAESAGRVSGPGGPVLLEFTRYDPLQRWAPGGVLNPKPLGRRERPDSLLGLRAERVPG